MLFLSAVSCFCSFFHLGIVIHDDCSKKTSLRRVFSSCSVDKCCCVMQVWGARGETKKKIRLLVLANSFSHQCCALFLLFTCGCCFLLPTQDDYFFYYYYTTTTTITATTTNKRNDCLLLVDFFFRFLLKPPLLNQNGKKREMLVSSHFLQYDITPSEFFRLRRKGSRFGSPITWISLHT